MLKTVNMNNETDD